MKYCLYPCLFIFALLIGCQNTSTTANPAPQKEATPKTSKLNRSSHLAKIENIAKQLEAKADQPQDLPLAQSLVEESKAYVKNFPRDKSNNPKLLFRAGEVARSIRQYGEAISLFGQVYTNYPKVEAAVKARFLEALTYEDGLQDKEKAKELYQILIDKHPEDPLAEQARQLLKVIDKTPEELVKEFQKNQQ